MMNKMNNKKGQTLQILQGMVAPLVGVAIVLVIGFLIMAEVKEQASDIEGGTAGNAWNGSEEVMMAMDDIPGWLPIVVVAVIGAAPLSLVQFFRSR